MLAKNGKINKNPEKGNDMAYNPEKELKKGAELRVMSLDPKQSMKVSAGKVTVGGEPGIVDISGTAAGKQDGSLGGTASLWLSIFRFMRPDGTVDHVAGWNIMIPLASGQTSEQTARAFELAVNLDPSRPYFAKAEGSRLWIYYREKKMSIPVEQEGVQTDTSENTDNAVNEKCENDITDGEQP